MILETINKPSDLKAIDKKHLKPLVEELRQKIIEVTSCNGGHIAPSLGVVELTVALHYVLDAPRDKIVWDVGHQSYAHKLLTGRREKFKKLRMLGGISGFPSRKESEYDAFGTGHSSTSISAALGMACARDLKGENYKVAAIIGDGSMTGGMAFEALNNAGHLKKNLIVILNDNEMFISGKVGALGEYLARLMTFQPLHKVEERVKKILQKNENWGKNLIRLARRSKVLLTPGMLFEEMGFNYFGPVDGHDLDGLIGILGRIRELEGPVLLHVVTKKGKGYKPAEENPELFHGTGSFDMESGETVSNDCRLNYQDVFGDTITEIAEKDSKVVAITAAMKSGTGLTKFAKNFPERFFDVGIAEQHAVTFAAGLAAEGIRPVCAIYSTFLQRAYDQIIHDVALQELPVIFAIDRAGIVGEDGPTHHGMFDLSYLASIPNMIVTAPSNENEMKDMLYSALQWRRPAAIRYPRGKVAGVELNKEYKYIEPGRANLIKEGRDVYIMAIGNMVTPAVKAAEELEKKGISAGVIDLRFAKPLDSELITEKALSAGRVITIEENVIEGGVGERIKRILPDGVKVDIIGIPDSFITYGTSEELRKKLGLNTENIVEKSINIISQKLK